MDDILARRARDRGVSIVIDTDAHSPAALGNLRWGVTVARRAWLESKDVLNTRPFDELRTSLRRNRAGAAR
jgi:DNA polymerase (family 10)